MSCRGSALHSLKEEVCGAAAEGRQAEKRGSCTGSVVPVLPAHAQWYQYQYVSCCGRNAKAGSLSLTYILVLPSVKEVLSQSSIGHTAVEQLVSIEVNLIAPEM